jgi:hypothetical protein
MNAWSASGFAGALLVASLASGALAACGVRWDMTELS